MKILAISIFAVSLSAWAQTAEPAKKDAASKPITVEAKPSDKVIGDGAKACVPGDTSPAGTVADGYRKVIEATPFGNACRWIAIK